MIRRGLVLSSLLLLLHPCCLARAGDAPQYDLVLRNGSIVDGTGKAAYRADLAIKDGRIAAIGEIPAHSSPAEIDASGKLIAPGFIDVHTHVDAEIFGSPAAENFVRDGVTTIVSGNCGRSVEDVGAYFSRINQKGAGLNVATLYGHNTVLLAVKGDRKGDLTPQQLAKARLLVRQAMLDGAVGISTGLIYSPGQFSPTEEIVEWAKVAGEFGGVYATHMRNEGSGVLAAIDEATRIAREAKIRVEISHFKLLTEAAQKVGGSNATLGKVLDARKVGLEIWLDQYPYTASSTSISTLIPEKFLEDGIDQARKRVKDPAYLENVAIALAESKHKYKSLSYVVVASSDKFPQYNGKNIVQIAQMRKLQEQKPGGAELLADASGAKPPAVTMLEQCRAVLEVFKAGNASCVYHSMDDTEVENIMRSPLVGVASDSGLRSFGVGVPHPRGYGTNARVLGVYAREKKLFSMEEAVRKMTSLPANSFRFTDRGLLKQGFVADVTIFDPKTVIDKATFDQPHQYPAGIIDVIVNGVPVLRDGVITGKLPGRAVFGPGRK